MSKNKYEKLIADEAETVAGEEPPAFFGGRKFEQIENIKAFLRNFISLDQFIESPNSFQSKINGKFYMVLGHFKFYVCRFDEQ